MLDNQRNSSILLFLAKFSKKYTETLAKHSESLDTEPSLEITLVTKKRKRFKRKNVLAQSTNEKDHEELGILLKNKDKKRFSNHSKTYMKDREKPVFADQTVILVYFSKIC